MLKVESSFDYPVASLGRLELRGADSLPHFHRNFHRLNHAHVNTSHPVISPASNARRRERARAPQMKRDSAEGSDALDGKRQRPCDIVPASYGGYSVGGSCACLLYTSPSPRDKMQSRMPSSA